MQNHNENVERGVEAALAYLHSLKKRSKTTTKKASAA